MAITITLNAQLLAKLGTVGTIGAGFAAGGLSGGMLTRGAFRHDRLADPNQIIEQDENLVVERKRPQLGPLTGLGSVALGAAAAGGGAIWSQSAAAQAKTAAGIAQHYGSRAVFAAGIGLIAGGVAMSMWYDGSKVRPA